MATIKKLQSLFSEKGMTTEERHEVIYNFTSGRTQSSRELSPEEIEKLCNALQGKYSAEMDAKRKRLLAAIFGMFKKMKKEASMSYVKAIACRAAGVKNFNDIPSTRLDSLYNAFINAQKDLDFSHRIISGYIEECKSYN